MALYPPAKITMHAEDKIRGRISLTKESVQQILDSNKAVPIGKEGKNKIHRLFYSEPDDLCFVAIQNENSGKVITICYPSDSRVLNGHNPKVFKEAKDLIIEPFEDCTRCTICGCRLKKRNLQKHLKKVHKK